MKYSNPMYLPKDGDIELNILNKNVLEISYCYRRDTNTTPLKWNFVQNGVFTPPSNLSVWVNGVSVNIISYSFKRRPIYVPLKVRDLRILNQLYLTLSSDVSDNSDVIVKDSSGTTLKNDISTTKNINRINPAIHVSQAGYNTGFVKKAFIGYFIGNGGELDLSYLTTFSILDSNNQIVFSSSLKPRLDVGYEYTPKPYQKVLEADFTTLNTPGQYKLRITDLGVSYKFNIHSKIHQGFFSTVNQGLLNQRCGYEVKKPISRHEKNSCHTKPAYIPMPAANFPETWSMIGNETNPSVTSVNQLYPFIKNGTLDVSLGHHDAGDYSKYVVNSSIFIHKIICGVDNLNLKPELNNELLETVKHESEFVYKMFDDDGGVFHLVYPKTRAYELDSSLQGSNFGDEQCVWIKTTIATAAASAALAEAGSSTLFRQKYGNVLGDSYINQAKKGWGFLMAAIAKYGFNGSFQQVRGGESDHTGALCYCAASLFAATGDIQYRDKLFTWLPDSNNIPWIWGWRVMYGFYGCAVRSYAFAARSGRRNNLELNANYLLGCDLQIIKQGDNLLRDSNNCAYGAWITYENKNYAGGGNWGWYFLSEFGTDIALANKIKPNSKYIDAAVLTYNYLVGNNPINVSSISGLGLKRPRIFVSNYQLNDFRTMPPNGQMRACVSAGPTYLEGYKNPDNTNELSPLCFPVEYDVNNKFAPQDRYADQWQVQDEETLAQTHSAGIIMAAWLTSIS